MNLTSITMIASVCTMATTRSLKFEGIVLPVMIEVKPHHIHARELNRPQRSILLYSNDESMRHDTDKHYPNGSFGRTHGISIEPSILLFRTLRLLICHRYRRLEVQGPQAYETCQPWLQLLQNAAWIQRGARNTNQSIYTSKGITITISLEIQINFQILIICVY